MFWGFAGLWDYEFRLLVGKIELFGLLMTVVGTNVCYGHVSLTAGQNDPFFSCTEHDEVIFVNMEMIGKRRNLKISLAICKFT